MYTHSISELNEHETNVPSAVREQWHENNKQTKSMNLKKKFPLIAVLVGYTKPLPLMII